MSLPYGPFASLWHCESWSFIGKLKAYGFSENVLKLMCSYLKKSATSSPNN